MTSLLEKVFKEVNKLPDNEQNEIAEIIMMELEDENKWTQSFNNSQDKLSELADEALEEIKDNKIKPLNL